MKNILDNSFRYKPSFDTDIKKTMERIRRQRKEAADKCAACEPWFDESAFILADNIRTLKRTA